MHILVSPLRGLSPHKLIRDDNEIVDTVQFMRGESETRMNFSFSIFLFVTGP